MSLIPSYIIDFSVKIKMLLFLYDLIASFVIIIIFADDAYRERGSGDVIIVVETLLLLLLVTKLTCFLA